MRYQNLLNGDVLIAEDEPILAYAARKSLLELGAQNAIIVPSNAGALAALAKQTFEFVLLDMKLSDGNAREVADFLLQNQVSFLIVSGYQDRESSLAPHCAEFLSKPFSRPQLIASIKRGIGGNNQPAAA